MSVRLQDATRDTDLVARQGGDEFLVLLGDIERDAAGDDADAATSPYVVAESVATRVQQGLKPPFLVGHSEFYSSASIGISVYPLDANDGTELMKNADAAMYRSKSAGPGGYVINSSIMPDPARRQTFTNRLREAVEHDSWELRYQPIVELDTGALNAVEALVRWKDPTGGIIRPGEFIPLAEEIGLIDAIGDWVLEEICRQSAEWLDAGLDLNISYNLSPRQLRHPDLAQHVIPFLLERAVDPSKLIMEITESAAMTDPERTQKVLMTLRDKGMRLAIDDFGTSSSSFARLKHLPVDFLKIDRSFIRDLPEDAHAASMVGAIVELATKLNMTPLAEGIETEDQRRFLIAAGCRLGQGYHFSRPVPASEIAARYSKPSSEGSAKE
jgi:EAL domain-containing protein (putative c-di-GMP-specific phosphodiesterase class I)